MTTPSLRMWFVKRALRALQQPTRSPAELRHQYYGRSYPRPAKVTDALLTRCSLREERKLTSTVYTLTPRTRATDWHILYTHGGAFVNPLQRAHWDVVDALIAATGATVTVPIYPLAPEHNYQETGSLLDSVYDDLCAGVSSSRIVLCGDSAGGNLALTQAIRYRETQRSAPHRLILLSPWLDLTMSNPDAETLEPRDVILRCAPLRELGRWWAGQLEPADPRVSPMFADLSRLPPIDIYQGTDDIFLPDARLLRTRVLNAKGPVELTETRGGFHVFMAAAFTPEARVVYKRIADSLAVQR
jgi:monoterpene epsilon-lactone hydrolase